MNFKHFWKAGWDWLREPLHFGVVLLALVPVGYALVYMDYHGQPAPYTDDWVFGSNIAVEVKQGTLGWDDLLQDYNGHRYLLTNLQIVFFTLLTDWNLRAEMWVNPLLIMLNLGLILLLLGWQQPRAVRLALVPLSALMFALSQELNLLVGFQSSWHFVTLLILLGLAGVRRASAGWLSFGVLVGRGLAGDLLVWDRRAVLGGGGGWRWL
ncbi:MAG: hypothetical protein HC915_20350, partial [Anaerolineae bacterium]|nr:hypothetical protein [Anaerolineae bacterium]